MTLLVVCPAHTSLAALCADPHALKSVGRGYPKRFIELRVDRMPDATPQRLAQALAHFGPERCMVTLRSRAQGGGLAGLPERTDAAQGALLEAAFACGAGFVDMERTQMGRAGFVLDVPPGSTTKLILSDHVFDGVPAKSTLARWYDEAVALGADVVKQAVMPSDAAELLDGIALAQQHSRNKVPLVYIGMGQVGRFTRVLQARIAPAMPLSYVALAETIAPGQLTLNEAQTLYALENVDATTPVYAVLGAPVIQSRSPYLHNKTLRHAAKSGVYVALQSTAALDQLIGSAHALLGVQGLSVTLPHKQNVMALCDRTTPSARAAGAANTLYAPRQEAGMVRWHADNTDGPAALGLLRAMRKSFASTAPRVLMLGAGGAARTLGTALAGAGMHVDIAARRLYAAEALAASLGTRGIELGDETSMDAALLASDIVVHCTPIGMGDNAQACIITAQQLELLPAHAIVLDTVYGTQPTALVRLARARGLRTIDGMALLLAQGHLQAQHFYGIEQLCA